MIEQRQCGCSEGCAVAFGLCHCGCGGMPPLAQRTRPYLRLIVGLPIHFIAGHGKKISGFRFEIRDMGYKTPCWIWKGPLNKWGYGRVRSGKYQVSVHRFEYEKARGPIPEGLDLDHLCRVRRCGNPGHMEPVTEAVNTRRGINCKLSAEMVEQIRAQASTGRMKKSIAQEFSVNETTVRDILSGRTWKSA